VDLPAPRGLLFLRRLGIRPEKWVAAMIHATTHKVADERWIVWVESGLVGILFVVVWHAVHIDTIISQLWEKTFSALDEGMNVAAKERDLIERTKRFIKADITCEELAERLRKHGLDETKGSIAAKIRREAFPAVFFIAVMKAIGREQVNLADV
jgi:Domain of unknown function (DUF6471)